jgi:hypothetical protein
VARNRRLGDWCYIGTLQPTLVQFSFWGGDCRISGRDYGNHRKDSYMPSYTTRKTAIKRRRIKAKRMRHQKKSMKDWKK